MKEGGRGGVEGCGVKGGGGERGGELKGEDLAILKYNNNYNII